MVLSKRKHDGEFVPWTPAGQTPAATPDMQAPPAKKMRTKTPATASSRIAARPRQTVSNYPSEISYARPELASRLPDREYYDPLSSSQPHGSQPGPSQPKKTGRSRKKADDEEPEEKRGAIFKKSCPKNILDRVERVMSQRFYMIDRHRVTGELKETFSVLGSTGNVYTVTIDKKPHCNCPDHLKGNHCKHILFIFLKVLQVTQASGFWYQKALLTSELNTIFDQAPNAPNSLANPRIREAHARATGKATAATSAETSNKKRIPGPDDDCPICYEGMHGVPETSLNFCEECGNALHKQCFNQWRVSSANSGKQLTCVWCRAPCVTAPARAKAAAGGHRTQDGYLNLADVSGISPIRDTSTYYHGPRRGERHYGYRDYLD